MTEVLRPYQVEVIAEFWRAVEAGQRRILLVAPTAAGKTVIARAIVEQARSQRLRLAVSRPPPRNHHPDQQQAARNPARHHPARRPAATARAGAGRERADAASPRHQGRHDGIARGRHRHRRRVPSRRRAELSVDHRAISRRDPARPHRHAMPWRRPRPRQRLPGHDPVPAGRRTRRAGLSGADPRLCGGRS